MSTRRSTRPNADGPDAPDDGPPLVIRQAIEAVTYSGILVGLALLVAVAIGESLSLYFGCSLTRGLVLAKQFLFFAGFGVLAYGAFRLRPGRPGGRPSVGSRLSRGVGGLGGSMRSDSDDDSQDEENPQSQRAKDSPHPEIQENSGDGDAETGFQRLVQATPPMRFFELEPKDRISGGAKILVAGVGILVLTMVMEFGFGLYNVPC